MRFLYNISIFLYRIAILLVSPFNQKARLFRYGRKDLFRELKKQNFSQHNVVWVHCASLGEFEQARPIIEKIHDSHGDQYKVLLTFFSPSGYEIRKNYELAEWIFYLPLDTSSNAIQFLDLVQPTKVLFAKYEFWHYYLSEVHKRNIPAYLFSAIFRKEQIFFKSYGGFYRNILSYFSHIYVQDENSRILLNDIGLTNITVAGDTRFDRVIEISKNGNELPEIADFKGDQTLIVIGSAWRQDLDVILESLKDLFQDNKMDPDGVRIVIAPHEIHASEIEYYKHKLGKCIVYSSWDKKTIDAPFMLLDTMGMLADVYRYADIAYVGGGFGKGIHNILEAAVYGIPVFYGPNHHKFKEATDLITFKGAPEIKNKSDFEIYLDDIFYQDESRKKWGDAAKNYVFQNEGATMKIMDAIFTESIDDLNQDE